MFLEVNGLDYSHSTLNNAIVSLEPETEHRFDNGIILGSVPKELVMKHWKHESKFPQFILACESVKPHLFDENLGRAAIRQEESGDLLLSGMITSARGEKTFEESRKLVEKERDVFVRLGIKLRESTKQ
ncbi:hypothetical protein ABK040_012539 [Willaertia magna]